MIVIPAHGRGGVFSNPIDTRDGVGTILDDVPDTQAGIVSLINRRKGGPVSVNVGDNQDLHAALPDIPVIGTNDRIAT